MTQKRTHPSGHVLFPIRFSSTSAARFSRSRHTYSGFVMDWIAASIHGRAVSSSGTIHMKEPQ